MFPHPDEAKGERAKGKGVVDVMKKGFLQGESPLGCFFNT